jgi:hypothetical protein
LAGGALLCEALATCRAKGLDDAYPAVALLGSSRGGPAKGDCDMSAVGF